MQRRFLEFWPFFRNNWPLPEPVEPAWFAERSLAIGVTFRELMEPARHMEPR